jgi:hypothetical protein
LTISSTYFPLKKIHKQTWQFPDGMTFDQTDHVLIDRRHGIDVQDIRSLRGADCDTDHYLVLMKHKEREKIKIYKRRRELHRRNVDTEILKTDESGKRRYSDRIQERSDVTKSENANQIIEEKWQSVRKCL